AKRSARRSRVLAVHDPAHPATTPEPALNGTDLEVVAPTRVLEPVRRPGALVPAGAAAAAATGFVAGAAALAVLRRGKRRRVVRRRRSARGPAQLVHVVSSRSFLVDVHLIERR